MSQFQTPNNTATPALHSEYILCKILIASNNKSIQHPIKSKLAWQEASLNHLHQQLPSHHQILRFLPDKHRTNQNIISVQIGKQFGKSFPKESTTRATKPLELIHTDVCGPIKPNSFGKNKYFLLFIDDYSRKTWVYFLKEKSELH